MAQPLISVIVPCYNQAQYLDECLQSVLDQTYENWECIIVNDGSPDNTEEVAKAWLVKDKRFRYIYQENSGVSAARNNGIENSNGEWIQFIDCDDKIASNKFSISQEYFLEYDIIVSNYFYFSKDNFFVGFNELTESDFTYKFLLFNWDHQVALPIHCPIFRKKLANKNFLTFLKAKEDWIFWLDFFKNKPNVKFINNALAFYRNNTNSVTKNSKLMIQQDVEAHLYIYSFLNEEEKKDFFEKRIFNKINDCYIRMKEKNDLISERHRIIGKLESKRYKLIDKILSLFGK